MKINKYFAVLILFIFIVACGLKTDPKSKDSFEIKIPKNITINNSDNGIIIKNTDNEYSLIVERSEKTDNCSTEFIFKDKIPPKKSFIDKDVACCTTYTYRLYNVDEQINVNSASFLKTITYTNPIQVKDLTIEYLDDTTVKVKPDFTLKPLFYTVYLDKKELFKTRKDEFTILLPYKLENILKIIPTDEYNNIGKPFQKLLINKQVAKLSPPKKINHIVNNSNAFLTWDKVEKAEGYKIQINNQKEFTIKTNIYNYKFQENEKCAIFKISSFSKYYTSEPTSIKICKDQ